MAVVDTGGVVRINVTVLAYLKGNRMKGSVYQINQEREMVAVQTEDGDFSIFELLGADPVEIRDVVSWKDDTALGGETLTNYTQGETYEVYFQNHHVTQNQLRQQLLF